MNMIAVLAVALMAAAPVEPSQRWSGMLADASLQKDTPPGGFVTEAKMFETLWRAWRPSEKVPGVDFATEFILIGTVQGPNFVGMAPTLDEQGNLRYTVGGTKRGGPGFGYLLLKVSRKGVKTVNGKPLEAAKTDDGITVKVIGTLRTGIVAIGGETTGTTITSRGVTWELDFGKDADLIKTAEKLSGQKVSVEGQLERRPGVEVKERWIVKVAELQAAASTP